ncbi:MAG: hypothetical protein HYZ49_21400 [Chloroflexi bacterium]|nr:hypothetical protein [Chloroflexota bacterium]
MRRLLLPLTLLLAALACNFPGFGPQPTATPRPTSTPTATFAPIGGGPATATPNASLPATATPTQPDLSVTASPTPTALITDTPTPTATRPVVFATATPLPPLNITNIFLEQVIKDDTRPNGAIAKIKIEFSGGKPPFTFYDEGLKQKGNPVDALTSCGATLVHTVRVDSADGQTDSQAYYFSPITCPP